MLGDFQIIREIGRGGMGVVYEAFDHERDLRVAERVLAKARYYDVAREFAVCDQPERQRVHLVLMSSDQFREGVLVPGSGPANGILVLNPDGSFIYTPDPDFAGTPIIELDGTSVVAGDQNGLTLQGGGSTIRGLVINRFLRLPRS